MSLAGEGRPLLMGILNITPDSFSDGGRHFDPGVAVALGLRMAEEGADIIDIGGESTRPGAARVSARDQLQRVMPVLKQLRGQLPAGCRMSIDTTRCEVAEVSLSEGADIINDVTAGRDDAGMFDLARRSGADIILMHMQGSPETMQAAPSYEDAVGEVTQFLMERAKAAEAAGIARDKITIDPGIGFGKSKQHNLQLLASLDALVKTGYPVLLGTSRKRFMGNICNVTEFSELVGATCATTAMGVLAGVRVFRVHDVRENRQALDVAWEVCRGKS